MVDEKGCNTSETGNFQIIPWGWNVYLFSQYRLVVHIWCELSNVIQHHKRSQPRHNSEHRKGWVLQSTYRSQTCTWIKKKKKNPKMFSFSNWSHWFQIFENWILELNNRFRNAIHKYRYMGKWVQRLFLLLQGPCLCRCRWIAA